MHSALSFIDSFLAYDNAHNQDIILGGDVNLNLLVSTSISNELQTIISANGFINAITRPMKVTPTCASLLDIFITNMNSDLIFGDVIITGIADNFGIFMYMQHIKKTKGTTFHSSNHAKTT